MHITITDDDNDISESLNKHVHTGLGQNVYPSWHKLALCLRTDWKRLKCWSLAEGAILKRPLQEAFRKSFDKPEICRSISALLETYAQYLGQDDVDVRHFDGSSHDMYCLNKHESHTLEWAFSIVDQFNDDEGLQKFREAVIVGKISDEIELVRWNHHH